MILMVLVACGESAPPDPTKQWEKARDKAHDGWDEEERIEGDHCLFAEDDISPSYQLAEQVKAEIEHPETFDAPLGKEAYEESIRNFWVYSLSGREVREFDIPMSEGQIENIKLGGQIYNPLNNIDNVSFYLPEYSNEWIDRPRHLTELNFKVETDQDNPLSLYAFYTAFGLVDHWTCETRLMKIEERK